MKEYISILQQLYRADVMYVAMGTWALKYYFTTQMKDYVLQDCDIVLAPTLNNLHKAIQVLQAENWETTVWNENIPLNAPQDFFQGKYYIRAKKGSLILDMTYEYAIDWETLWACAIETKQISIASVLHILMLKYEKIKEKEDITVYCALEKLLFNHTDN